ncbi:helix-turn-helix domain-containing protein [Serratia nematodiphila]|uniref:helix-turn-helix domain-containing protein n=1 Tax=Serratia nematodiphila TaxID=458197 RepID=UPI0011D50A57|nr:helix-turn-helix transcriptional regulator [Serratia nematodiphila]TXE57035.1 helix-turn-helix transcriptional regulator [Serratia nematodiphila]
MSTLQEMMAKRSPESRARIEARVEELRREIALAQLREELSMSQTELARLMGVAQPTIAKMENQDNDPRLSTLKRYVAALGGDISIDITLPTGKRVAYHI